MPDCISERILDVSGRTGGIMKRSIISICIAILIAAALGACKTPSLDAASPGSPAVHAHEAEQDFAKERLEKSPRHQEWVKVKNGSREVQSFVVYPEVKEKA